MSPFKWLYYLLVLENIVGIYRNYCNHTKIKKYFIIFQIFLQIMVHFVAMSRQLYLLFKDGDNQISYIYADFIITSFLVGLISIVSGTCNSSAFTSYLESICQVSKCFEDHNKYIKSLKKIVGFGFTLVLFCFASAVIRSLDDVNFDMPDDDPFAILCVPIFFSQTLLRFIIFFQKLMLFVVTMIVVNLSKCITSLVSVTQERFGSYDTSTEEQFHITKEQIQGWVELYLNLANCCERVSLCLGRQFFFSLMISVSYYIVLTYEMIYLSVLDIRDVKIGLVLLMYVSLTILPIVAGQLAQNEGVKFHRGLVRLYNKMILFETNETEARMIRDFIRLMKKNPIEIKLLTKLPVGAYLLPVILMTTVNYIIVMLQFNNIV